jgi:hypothetical protein
MDGLNVTVQFALTMVHWWDDENSVRHNEDVGTEYQVCSFNTRYPGVYLT